MNPKFIKYDDTIINLSAVVRVELASSVVDGITVPVAQLFLTDKCRHWFIGEDAEKVFHLFDGYTIAEVSAEISIKENNEGGKK